MTPRVRYIWDAVTPETAAKIGRGAQLNYPECVRADWEDIKVEVIRRALMEKLKSHDGPRQLLLHTVCSDGRVRLIEDSPVDPVWGAGRDGTEKFTRQLARPRLSKISLNVDV